jgi:hypothetical protein
VTREERKLYQREYRKKNKYALAAKQREYDLRHKAKRLVLGGTSREVSEKQLME